MAVASANFAGFAKKSQNPLAGEDTMIIGLDVGGTHTDVVLLGDEGLIRDFKVRTDSENLLQTVLTGLEHITEGIDAGQIRRAVLSTTLTTNAIVQSKNPAVGMIVSAGPGVNPELFRTNEDYYCVSGSIDHRGREVEPVNEGEIREIGERMKAAGIRNVGIVGKFSVRNPAHERKIYNFLKNDFGRMFMGHQVSGNLDFPRRIATTFLNTSVRQIHKKFFDAVRESLALKGLKIPIHVLKADGGTMSLEASVDSPSQTILSGPSASVMGAIAFAEAKAETLVLDIGGTTTDMAILIDQVPLLAPKGITLGPYNTHIRSLQSLSVGIGGDSVVRVVDGGITVGPDRDGPAMAFGGAVPTPTDAIVVLGLMEEGEPEAARRGIEQIAAALGTGVDETAHAIFDETCRKILENARRMIDEINSKPVYTVHELREGYQVDPKKILVLGGPAPQFARRLGEISGYDVAAVPRWKVANAIGAALARTTCEVTLFADTQQEIASAPEENFSETVDKNFSEKDAVKKAFELLRKKALSMGAESDDLKLEVVESHQFNMVRGFYTAGRNIRVKVQVKPGLIHDYGDVGERLGEAVPDPS